MIGISGLASELERILRDFRTGRIQIVVEQNLNSRKQIYVEPRRPR